MQVPDQLFNTPSIGSSNSIWLLAKDRPHNCPLWQRLCVSLYKTTVYIRQWILPVRITHLHRRYVSLHLQYVSLQSLNVRLQCHNVNLQRRLVDLLYGGVDQLRHGVDLHCCLGYWIYHEVYWTGGNVAQMKTLSQNFTLTDDPMCVFLCGDNESFDIGSTNPVYMVARHLQCECRISPRAW